MPLVIRMVHRSASMSSEVGISETEYQSCFGYSIPSRMAPEFDHGYVKLLGMRSRNVYYVSSLSLWLSLSSVL